MGGGRTPDVSVASFELRRVEWTAAKAVTVVAAVLSAGIHLAIATTSGNDAFAVLGLGILLGFVVFFTELWMPVHYLVGAVYVGVTTVFWLVAGRPQPVLGGLDKAVQAVLIVSLVYLVVVEMRERSED
jgi:hypothetical protein